MYIKALEQEVLRLKETFGSTVRERDAMAEEIRRLKEILAANGITYTSDSLASANSAPGRSSSGSISGSYAPPSSTTSFSPPPSAGNYSGRAGPTPGRPATNAAGVPTTGIDYDQIGIDFVLTYDHAPYLSPPPGL